MNRPGPLWPDETRSDLALIDVESALARDPRRIDLSVVIPMLEETADPSIVIDEIIREIEAQKLSHEVLLVIDGPLERALETARQIADTRGGQAIRVLQLTRALGEASALSAGFEAARGELILTSATHRQAELEHLELAIEPVRSGEADLVIVRRAPRLGSYLSRLRSWFFHWLIRQLTATSFRDLTGNLRVMTRRVAQRIDLYGDLHRFLPVLALELGFEVVEVDLPQHPEDRLLSRPTLSAYPRRLLDLLTIFFLSRFTQKPLRFFGSIGLLFTGIGGVVSVYLALYKLLDYGGISGRPMLLLGLLMIVLGVQSIGIGLLGEIIIFTHSRRFRGYRVRQVLGAGADEGERTNRLSDREPSGETHRDPRDDHHAW